MKDESDTTVLLDYTKAGDWGDTNVQHCIKCGQIKLPSDYWQRRITYWQDLACANRKVAEEAQAQRDKLTEALKTIRRCLVEGAVTLSEKTTAAKIAIQIDDLLKECGK